MHFIASIGFTEELIQDRKGKEMQLTETRDDMCPIYSNSSAPTLCYEKRCSFAPLQVIYHIFQ